MADEKDDWRARLKEKRKAEQKKRRAELANDPRVVAMKEKLKQRRRAAYDAAKARRKEYADERKKRDAERAADERARRSAELGERVRPATRPGRDNP